MLLLQKDIKFESSGRIYEVLSFDKILALVWIHSLKGRI